MVMHAKKFPRLADGYIHTFFTMFYSYIYYIRYRIETLFRTKPYK